MHTVVDIRELLEHWACEPPLAVVIKSYLGVKPVVRSRRTQVVPPTRPKVMSAEETAAQARIFERMASQQGRGGR